LLQLSKIKHPITGKYTVNINKQKYMGNLDNKIAQTENKNIKNIGKLQVKAIKVLLITVYLSNE
jgi:hypothetical protein